MFHLASNSAGCPDFAAQAQSTNPVPMNSTYTFLEEPETGHGASSSTPLTNASSLSRLRVSRKGVLSGLLGASPRHTCFCGFDQASTPSGIQCTLPTTILQDVLSMELPPTPDMAYLRDTIAGVQAGKFFTTQNERVQRTLKQLWRPARWPCPEMDPSDHWGIVRDAQQWATTSSEGSQIRANDLLEVGYGGFRAGTVGSVLDQSRSTIHPGEREGTMNPWDGTPITGHTRCEMHRSSMRPESLASHFVNDLFPAAQGVVDSPAVSHCMRFAIELARLSAIAIVTGKEATVDTILSQMSSTSR